jgi:multidrug transporter EmrE-like cation transporter
MDHLLILLSVFFTTGGQLLQKIGATKAAAMPSKIHFLIRVLSQPETWWAITCLAIGTVLWLAVLYRMEVSKAFPFLSIGFVLVILISRYHLNETISIVRWLGLGLIGSGMVLISQS